MKVMYKCHLRSWVTSFEGFVIEVAISKRAEFFGIGVLTPIQTAIFHWFRELMLTIIL